MVKVISLTGALSNACEHGIAAVLRGNVADQLLNQDGLAHAGAAEKPDLSALLVRAQQIHHLDARLQKLFLRGLFLKFRRGPVNGFIGHSLGRRFIIYGLAQDIENPPQGLLPYRNGNGCPRSDRVHSSHQAVGASHGDTPDRVVSQVLGDFHGELAAVSGRNENRFVDLRQFTLIEADVKHRPDDLGNFASVFSFHFYLSFLYNTFRNDISSPQRLRTGYNLRQLLRNGTLAGSVVL